MFVARLCVFQGFGIFVPSNMTEIQNKKGHDKRQWLIYGLLVAYLNPILCLEFKAKCLCLWQDFVFSNGVELMCHQT